MITITPKTKVGELLDTYPELEKVLLEMSPAFAKLRNPVLRKTVARVATIQQIAVVGGLKADHVVNVLRKATGQDALGAEELDSTFLSPDIPEWLDMAKITLKFDASPVINSGGSPMNEILKLTGQLQTGDIMQLITPFIPAPVLEILVKKGFKIHAIQMQDHIESYIQR